MLLVVTPTLGKSEFLTKTIESVKALPVRHIHALVAPRSVLAQLERHRSTCVLLAESDNWTGMYGAINTALTHLNQAWTHFTYINDDDVLKYSATKFWGQIEKDSTNSLSVFYGRVDIINATGKRVGWLPLCSSPKLNLSLWSAGKVPLVQQGTIISRSAIIKCGLFSSQYRYAADMDYLIRLHQVGCHFSASSFHVASFRLTPGQLSEHRSMFDQEISDIKRERNLVKIKKCHVLFLTAYIVIFNLLSYAEHVYRYGLRSRRAMFK